MKKRIVITAAIIAVSISACTDNNQPNPAAQQQDTSLTKKNINMNNQISIVEIPVADFPRAVKFYQSLMALTFKEVEMDGVQMGVIPNDEGTVHMVLAKGHDYKPSPDGAVIYLNAGKDLQPMLDRIEPGGGEVILPKTMISPEMGFFALFKDTEGNKLGLHSTN